MTFIQAVLENDYASGLLPREELRKLFDLLLSQSKLSAYDANRLKQRYFTAEELRADQEARDAEALAATRRKQDAEAIAMRDKYSGMADHTFQSIWKFTENYQYLRSEMTIAAQIVHDGLAAQLQKPDSVLTKMDAVYFLHVCARLIQHGAMDWAEVQDYISRIKEVSDDAPGNNTNG